MTKPKKEDLILYSLGAVFALFITMVYGLFALFVMQYISEYTVIVFSFLPFSCMVSAKMILYIFDRMKK